MRGIIFKTAKAAFRKAYRKHKSSVRRAKIEKKKRGLNIPVVPYDLIKSDIKRKIRGTKFTAEAEFKAQPGLKRRIKVGIERAKRNKKKFRPPVIVGKAFASDKKGKTMQIQPLTFEQRKLMKKEMAESAKRIYARMMRRNKKKGGMAKLGYNSGKFVKSDPGTFTDIYGKQRTIKKPRRKVIGVRKFVKTDTYVDSMGKQHNLKKPRVKRSEGGLNTIKMVKNKLEKASAAHAGQAKALGKVIDKKKMLVGGLLTAGIKGAARKLFKSGTRKTQQIVKESGGTRKDAKSDVKSAINNELKGKLSTKEYSISSPFYNKKLRRQLIRDINLLKK